MLFIKTYSFKRISNGLLTLICLLCFGASARAQISNEIAMDSVFSMSFEDLLNVKVVSAAKKSEKISESIASVELITADEIKSRGHYTLLDILRSVTMIDVNAAGQGYYSDIGARGVNPRANMGKYWQILIDGHDMSWYQFSRNHVSPAWLSVENIEQIEIVKGPSSALWGANAYFGVINIITKSGTNHNSASSSFMYGSNETYSVNVHADFKLGNKGEVTTFISQYADNIPRKIKEWSLVEGKDIYSDYNFSSYFNWYTKIKSGPFAARIFYGQDRSYHSIASFAVGAKDGYFPMDKSFVELQWSPIKTKKTDLTLSTYFDFNTWGEKARYEDNPFSSPAVVDTGNQSSTDNFVRYMKGNDRLYGVKILGNHTFNEYLDFSIGGDFKYVDALRWYFPSVWEYNNLDLPEFSLYEFGLYGQALIKPAKFIDLSAGIRYDYHEVYKEVWSPRASIVFKPKVPIVFKLIYGSAYKAPSLHELYYFRGSIYGNPTLAPEENNTLEAQFIYRYKDHLKLSVSVFSIKMHELIVYKSRDAGLPLEGEEQFPPSQRPSGTRDYRQQQNKGENTSQGLELNLDIKPYKNLILSFAGTYRNAYTTNDTADIALYYAPKYKLHSSLNYKLNNTFEFVLYSRYHGKSETEDYVRKEPGAPYPDEDNTPYAPSFITFDFIVTAKNLIKNTEFQLKVANFTNAEYYEASRDVLYHQPEISVFGKALVRF